MNSYFNEDIVEQYYPEAGELMFPAMKIWKLPDNKQDMLSEVCANGEYFAEEKIDGAFYQLVRTEHNIYLFGRTISKGTGILTEKIKNTPHLKKAFEILPPKTILIGEIFIPCGTSKDTVHIMGCLPEEAAKRQNKEGLIKYYVHDIIYYDGVNLQTTGAENRYKILKAIWEKHNLYNYSYLLLAKKIGTNIEEAISTILKNGGEGAVLKRKNAPYVPDKRPAWLTIKVKQMDSIDLICTGVCPPTKEYTGKGIETWPYWCRGKEISIVNRYRQEGWEPVTKYYALGLCGAIEIGAYNDKGQLKLLGTVSSGLTDADRQAISNNPYNYILKVVSLDCMSIDHEGKTIRHPVFNCWREDKNAKDCLISEVF